MAVVTSNNFEELLPDVEAAINNSSFIAIDTEFTGLHSSLSFKPNLFDSNEQRYHKLRSTASSFAICQFGISTFINEKEENRYNAKTYVFYVRPHSIGTIDRCFSFQASCMQFLCQHNFDFQKFAYESIPYLNNVEEKQLKKELTNKTHSMALYRDINETALQNQCSPVSSWLTAADEGDSIKLERHKELPIYISLKELNQKFKSVWALAKDDNTIIVKKVSSDKRKELEKNSPLQDEKLLFTFLGFTQVFRMLVSSKKPIIGHNMTLDLLFMYHHFYMPLPKSYKDFKREVHKLFPILFDTKHIISSLQKELEKLLPLHGNLSDIFNIFQSPNVKLYTLFSPCIYQGSDYVIKGNPHEAGYDAFAAGYVFIQTAHILAMKETTAQTAQVVSWKGHLNAIQNFKNKINLIRARTHYMNLEGADPASHRPQWLYVKIRNPEIVLESSWIATEFSSYGSVDVMLSSSDSALVAVGNYGCAKDILSAFHCHPDILVTRYNVFLHSKVVRNVLWCTCLLSGTIISLLMYKTWRLIR